MVIIFFLLLLLGLMQIWLLYRQQQRKQRLHIVESIASRNALSTSLRQNFIGRRIIVFFNDVRFHLLGEKNNMVLRHGVIILLVQVGGVYVSQEFLHLSLFTMLPVLFTLTLYALYLRARKRMRQDFEVEFSEALNIINSSIRAGNTVTQGINECGKKLEGAVGEELRQVSQRLDIGEDVENVFMGSYQRLPYREYYFFIVTVLINMRGGGQVKEVMSRLGTLISDSRIIERKKYSMTAEVRMSIRILTAIPIFFFFFLKYQSPANFDVLLFHPVGQIMLYYAIASIFLGLLIVWIMMNRI